MDIKARWMGLRNAIIRCTSGLECPTDIGVDVVCPSSRVERAGLVVVGSEITVVTILLMGKRVNATVVRCMEWVTSRPHAPHKYCGQAPSSGRQRQTDLGFFCLALCAIRDAKVETRRMSGWIEEEWRPVHGANSTTPTRQRRFVSTPVKEQVILFCQSSGTFPGLTIAKPFYGIWLNVHQAEDGRSCSRHLTRSLKMFLTVSRDP